MSTSHLTAPTTGQVRFPGQAAAPEGPCDLLPMYLMHHAFRRDLRMFAAAAAVTPLEDRATWRALQGRWEHFARILHLHHQGEDEVLWPLLRARVAGARDQATLDAMEAEHGEIDPLLAACAKGLARLAVEPDADTRAALAVRLAAARERLGAHLGHEEADAMALVQQRLTPSEWHALDEQFARHYRPADALFALPWVLHEVPAETWDRVRGFVGTSAVTAWRLGLRRRFERGERRAFRHVLPAAGDVPGARWLPGALGVVVATDVVGGLLDVAAGRSTLETAWGSGATLCAPLPMVAFQAVLVVLATRAGTRTSRVASGALAAACLVSVASGFFDGQLARADLSTSEIAFQYWLLAGTAVLGALGLLGALRRQRGQKS